MTHQAQLAPAEVLDYETLFADYQKGLVDRLRGFGAAAECLSLWVPDEDPATSLRNLWDAAAAAGEREITVYIGPTTATALDSDEVLATAARFGVATLTFGRTGWLLEVQELRAAAPMVERRAVASRAKVAPATTTHAVAAADDDAIHPIYLAAIARAAELGGRQHEGDVQPSSERIHVRVQLEDTTLALAVDPSTHVIERAAFTNAPHPGVMETLCALVEGMPILDAADQAPCASSSRCATIGPIARCPAS